MSYKKREAPIRRFYYEAQFVGVVNPVWPGIPINAPSHLFRELGAEFRDGTTCEYEGESEGKGGKRDRSGGCV